MGGGGGVQECSQEKQDAIVKKTLTQIVLNFLLAGRLDYAFVIRYLREENNWDYFFIDFLSTFF